MTPSELLETIATALYGAQFQKALADDLGVSDRRVRRWLDGQVDPPNGVWSDLVCICDYRRNALAEMAKDAHEAAKGAESTLR